METISPLINSAVEANIYWNMLKDLSAEVKLDLISRLSNSLLSKKSKAREEENWVADFIGKWQDTRSAEEIVNDIREARTLNKEVNL